MQIEKSITVPTTRETAFDYVSHLENAYEWDPAIVESRCVTALPLGPGSRFRLTVTVGPRFLPLTFIVKEFDRPQRLVLEGWGPSFRTVDTIRFDETGDGGTVIRYHSHIRLPFGLLTEPLTKPVLTHQATRALNGLAEALAPTKEQTRSPLGKMADRTVAGAVAQFTVFGWNLNKRGFRPFDRNLTGHRILVTGATSGLGWAASQRLASMGADLVLVGRSPQKLQEKADRLRALRGAGEVTHECADLLDLNQVLDLGAKLRAEGRPLHTLINNAGALFAERKFVEGELERTTVVNLLSPFFLIRELTPLLQLASGARIVNVSSGGMYTQKLSVDALRRPREPFRGEKAYAQAKRALVVLTEELARELEDDSITVHSMHPGWAATPGVAESLPRFWRLMHAVLRTPEQGADTIVWLAASEEARKTTGGFWFDRMAQPTHLVNRTKEAPAERRELLEFLGGIYNQKRPAEPREHARG